MAPSHHQPILSLGPGIPTPWTTPSSSSGTAQHSTDSNQPSLASSASSVLTTQTSSHDTLASKKSWRSVFKSSKKPSPVTKAQDRAAPKAAQPRSSTPYEARSHYLSTKA